MTTTIGTQPELDSTEDKWEEYLEICEYFFESNRITDEKLKKSTMLMAVGTK